MVKLLSCIRGATGIEYALLAGLISVAGMAAMGSTGTSVDKAFCRIADSMDGKIDKDCAPKVVEEKLYADPYAPGENGWPAGWGLGYGDTSGNSCQMTYNYNTKQFDLTETRSGSCPSHMAGNEVYPGSINRYPENLPPNYPGSTWKP